MKNPATMDRRRFLKMAGMAGLGAAAAPILSPAIGQASFSSRLKVAQQTRMMMGTYVSITVLDPSAQKAQDAMSAAFERMTRLTPLFDRHASGGVLYQINHSQGTKDAPPLLREVLSLSSRIHQATGGAFDITVAPIVDAFRRSFSATGAPPAKMALEDALALVGGARLSGDAVLFTKPGACLTLDGVAKGFLADQGLAAAAKTGVKHALINAGGDIVVLGDKGGRPWRVAVADPAHPSRPKYVVSMKSGALATSGDYEVFFDRERLFHHIVNPSTGHSPISDTSASVRAPKGVLADALSTACFVLKPEEAMAFLKSRQGLEGLILTRAKQRFATPGFFS